MFKYFESRQAKLLLMKPSFIRGETFIEALLEAKENVYLQHISKMIPHYLTFSNRALEIKMIALLTLLFHEYFIAQQRWFLKEDKFTRKHIIVLTTHWENKLREDLVKIRPRSLEHYINKSFRELLNSIANYFELRADIYPQYQSVKAAEMKKYFNDFHFQLSHDLENLSDFTSQFTQIILQYFSDTQAEQLIARSIRQDLLISSSNRAKRYSDILSTLCDSYNLLNEKPELVSLNDEFVHLHIAFHALVFDTANHIPELNHGMYPLFSNLLKDLNTNELIATTLRELYLEQIRKPHLQTLFTSPFQRLSTWVKNLCPNINHQHSNQATFSLHERLEQSYRQARFILGSTKSFKGEASTHTVAIINSDFMTNSYRPSSLFRHAVPGKIHANDIELFEETSTYQHSYATKFISFDPHSDARHNPFDKHSALKLFLNEVKNARSVSQLAALTQVAKPYINRHRHPNFDYWVGIENTNTWKFALKVAREKGLSLLTEDAELQVNTCQYWRQNNLFTQHRENFFFKGAFKNTRAVNEINALAAKISVNQTLRLTR